jgi:hypothetical protein
LAGSITTLVFHHVHPPATGYWKEGDAAAMLELIMYDGAGTHLRLDGGIAAVTPARRYQDGV